MIGLVDRIKKTAPAPGAPRAVKIRNPENKPDPAQNIPAPSPANLGPEYERLWHRAWKLANEIDNPEGAPLADRRARLPELLVLRDRLTEIEKQGGTNVPKAETPTTTSDFKEIKQIKQDGCPARCRRTGKCHARAYFEGKSGPAKGCEPMNCKHISNERGTDER